MRKQIGGSAYQLDSPIEHYIFTFLDGDTGIAFNRTIKDIPPGIVKNCIIYSADTETDHETVYLRILINDAIVIPTKIDTQGILRNYLPLPPISAVLNIPMFYPLHESGEIEVRTNAAPTSGLTVIINHQPIALERRGHKTVTRFGLREAETEEAIK